MHFIVCAINLLILVMPLASGWAEGSNILLDPTKVCKKTQKLPYKILEICKQDSRNKTSLLKKITGGISLGFRECENQFRHRRWNCTNQRRSMKKILMRDTRETAFVNAITAAGISYTIAKACSMGELVECSCDKNLVRHNVLLNGNNVPDGSTHMTPTPFETAKTSNKNRSKMPRISGNQHLRKANKRKAPMMPEFPGMGETWEWSGCDDNVNFGNRKSKDFLDSRFRRRSDIKTLVRIQNNDAGRLAVKKSMRFDCKCHGLSGSCTMRTCWVKLPSFSEVAHRLRDRYDGATKVNARNDGTSFMPSDSSIKPPIKQDLVYTEDSPDFCKTNPKIGSLGVHNRECNITSSGEDSCEILCCNYGYERSTIFVKSNCKCKFIWCCDVVCNVCTEKKRFIRVAKKYKTRNVNIRNIDFMKNDVHVHYKKNLILFETLQCIE